MTSPEQAAAAAAPRFDAIAMIDDGLQPMRFEHIPESERDSVRALLGDAEVLEDLAMRGVDVATVGAAPDEAIDALTKPDMPNGMAYAKISDVSANTVRMIDRRQMMRQIAASIRSTDGCEVAELGPESDLSDIARFDLVFIDYYLDDREADGSRAERIASDVNDRRDRTRRQQIVLMSTSEGVRALRTQFRKNASIEAASFAFVAKKDLDEDWKVKAHLEMLARGLQHSAALGDYISSVKKSAKMAAENLSTTLDDLDIGDFAYIQRIALHADGHPLGDYISWLLSSHLTALAFEGGLRQQQADVDKMEFEDGPLSPSEPSVVVAKLYHDALFARNLGALGCHPRAEAGSPIADVPFVQLGDVFLTKDRARAVVVLSPDCDLAFSTDKKRLPDRNLGVILLFGDPTSVTSEANKAANASTEGMVDGSEVYRIDWRFNSFKTVPLGELLIFLSDQDFDVTKRDRLRPIYSLKLQHELGNHLMRVGPPIMPPIGRHAKSRIRYRVGDEVKNVELESDEVVISRFKKTSTVRLTPSLVAKLKAACHEALDDFASTVAAMPESTPEAVKARKPMVARLDGLKGQVGGPDYWSGMLGDQRLPTDGECTKLKGNVHLAAGVGWAFPAPPAVVLVVGDGSIELTEGAGDPHLTPEGGAASTDRDGAARAAKAEPMGAPRPLPLATIAKGKKGKPERQI